VNSKPRMEHPASRGRSPGSSPGSSDWSSCAIAGRTVRLGERYDSSYKELVHPVHQAGRVFAWEVFEYLNGEEEQ